MCENFQIYEQNFWLDNLWIWIRDSITASRLHFEQFNEERGKYRSFKEILKTNFVDKFQRWFFFIDNCTSSLQVEQPVRGGEERGRRQERRTMIESKSYKDITMLRGLKWDSEWVGWIGEGI